MPMILTSNGLTSIAIHEAFATLLDEGYTKAAIVVTADPEYRERNLKAVRTKEEFDRIGFRTNFFDIEFTSPQSLIDYDIVYLNGGNPFYLLHQIRKSRADRVLRELLDRGKVLSGASAGSIVLGETLALITEFDPQLSDGIGLTDTTGIGLTTVILCPHYSKYMTRYERFEERIRHVEQRDDITITRLDDGEAIVIQDGQSTKIS